MCFEVTLRAYFFLTSYCTLLIAVCQLFLVRQHFPFVVSFSIKVVFKNVHSTKKDSTQLYLLWRCTWNWSSGNGLRMHFFLARLCTCVLHDRTVNPTCILYVVVFPVFLFNSGLWKVFFFSPLISEHQPA